MHRPSDAYVRTARNSELTSELLGSVVPALAIPPADSSWTLAAPAWMHAVYTHSQTAQAWLAAPRGELHERTQTHRGAGGLKGKGYREGYRLEIAAIEFAHWGK